VAQLAVATTPTAVANNAHDDDRSLPHDAVQRQLPKRRVLAGHTHLTTLDESIGRVSGVLKLSQPKMISLSGRSGCHRDPVIVLVEQIVLQRRRAVEAQLRRRLHIGDSPHSPAVRQRPLREKLERGGALVADDLSCHRAKVDALPGADRHRRVDGSHEPLLLNPVNAWTATLILAIALDLGPAHACGGQRRRR
jgi:hypothetical protein